MSSGLGNVVPPLLDHVVIYFSEKGLTEQQALTFFEHYQRRQWQNARGEPIKDWKMRAWQWIWQNHT